jgi:hypothetical protein
VKTLDSIELESHIAHAENLAADVLRLSIEPLLTIARHSNRPRIVALLEEVVECSTRAVAVSETVNRDLLASPLEPTLSSGQKLDTLDCALQSFRRLHELRNSIMSSATNCNDPFGGEQCLNAVNDSIELESWIASVQRASSDETIQAKAEILLDWVGDDRADVAVDQLSASLCRDISAPSLARK